MAKSRTLYICQSCGNQSPKWLGKCPVCGEWNTYVEEVINRDEEKSKERGFSPKSDVKPVALQDISESHTVRLITHDSELDRVLGGGIVPGSLVLIGGEPGIGKSTLMLQLAAGLEGKTILYVSGEESDRQIKMRADRMNVSNKDCYMLMRWSRM
jgi:DNA repair protein RadA/Sms